LAGVHGEGDEAVDVARLEAGIVERRLDGFAGEAQLAAARRLRELGLPDAGDGGAVSQCAAHDALLARGRPITAVPDTRSPLSLVALNSISTRPSPSTSDLPVTVPVYSSTEPAYAGTPRRIAIFRIIASGPAQSVRKRLQYPLSLMMLRKMFGEPWELA